MVKKTKNVCLLPIKTNIGSASSSCFSAGASEGLQISIEPFSFMVLFDAVQSQNQFKQLLLKTGLNVMWCTK